MTAKAGLEHFAPGPLSFSLGCDRYQLFQPVPYPSNGPIYPKIYYCTLSIYIDLLANKCYNNYGKTQTIQPNQCQRGSCNTPLGRGGRMGITGNMLHIGGEKLWRKEGA